MKCKACEVVGNRSLLKVNEDLRNEHNTAIRLLVNFSTFGLYNLHIYISYKPQARHRHATELCSDVIYR